MLKKLLFFIICNSVWIVANAQISGIVFRDFNANGVRSTSNPIEPLLANVTVIAYNSAGVPVDTAITSALGAYSFTGLGLPLRIEFTGIDSSYFTGPSGSGNASSVQFYTAASTTANYGVNYPSDYCQSTNPNMLTMQYTNGNPLGGGTAGSRRGLITFDYNSSGNATGDPDLNPLGYTADPVTYSNPTSTTGPVWGIAYQRSKKRAFAAAFIKRHQGIGPLGEGGIYVVDYSGGAAPVISNFVDVNTIGINTGQVGAGATPALRNADRGLTNVTTVPNPSGDPQAFDAVGKIGLGDLDISDDESTLYVINLFDQKLYAILIDADNNPSTPPTSSDVTAYTLPANPCTSGTLRPFAVKFYKGKVYVGAVCDASLQAFIYRLDGSSFVSVPVDGVNSIPLTYTKGQATSSTGCNTAANNGWFTWSSTPQTACNGAGTGDEMHVRPTPILCDIEFDVDGSMIISFMDRSGHQFGAGNTQFDGNGFETVHSGGDIIRICHVGGNFVMQGASGCSNNAANNQGPNGGEFYHQDLLNFPAGGGLLHQETTVGGMALLPGRNEIAVTCFDPFGGPFLTGGVNWFNNTTGASRTQGYFVYFGTTGSLYNSGDFSKAAGMGDIELLCDAAPIEIGNRVWLDNDMDGIQDANEPGLASASLQLFMGSVQVGTTTTDANGHYYFNQTNVTMNGASGILPNTNYEIRLNTGSYVVTALNTDGSPNGDARDNDASGTTTAVIAFTSGYAGQNNHTYDFGLQCSGSMNIAANYTPGNCSATSTVPSNTASLQIVTSGDKVAMSTTGNPTTTYSAANAVVSGSYTYTAQNGKVDTFYVRVWSGPFCFKDTIIQVTPIRCCPAITFSTPANNAAYCSGTTIPTLAITTNAISPDSIQYYLYSIKQTSYNNILNGGGILLGTVKITGSTATSLANTAPLTNVSLPTLIGTSVDTIYLYAVHKSSSGDTICKTYSEKQIILKPQPAANITGVQLSCNAASVTLSSGFATTYKWGKMPSATTLATTQTYSPVPTASATSTYWLVTTNAGTCISDTAYHTISASNGVLGTVFRDFNSDGIINANENVGFANIKVRLYNNNGILVDSAITNSDGQYAFPSLSASMGKVKIEFDKSTFPPNTQETFSGTNNGTDVQFVTAPNCSMNLGLKEIGDYCGTEPKIVTPIFIDGASSTNTTGLNEALYSLNYSNYAAKTTEATRTEIGSTWGIAYAKKTKQLFSAAFLKRHVGLKDGKLGQIYVTDMSTPGSPTAPWLDVSTLGLAGNWQFALDAARGLGNAGTPSKDSLAFSQIAQTGLGDIDMSEDETKLYAMDLINKQLLVIDIASKTLLGAYPVPSVCSGNATPSYYAANAQTFTATDGKLWKNGYYFNTDNSGLGYTQTITNPNNVTDGTTDAALYATSVYNNVVNYQFPLGNGSYSVKLHLATNGLPNNTNFNVVSEGTIIFSNVNVYAEAGNVVNKAVTKSFTIAVTDGVLDIRLAGNAGTLALISGFEITPTSGQASGQTRPFAIKPYKGKVYVGAVCDASGSQDMSDLNAGIFEFNPQTNVFNTTPVLTFPLNYAKGALVAPSNDPKRWFPWTSVYPNNTVSGISTGAGGFDIYNQPVLSDIEFDLDGSMIMGFFDRMGHQMAANVNNFKPNGQLSGYAAVAGDLLRAYYNGSTYELENNAKEGISSTLSPTAGANNNQGPGGGEFYFGDNTGGDATGGGTALGHYEILMGGLSFLPGSGEVRATAGDPIVFSSGGFSGFNNKTGSKQNPFTLYTGTSGGVQLKSSGLGDLELMCDEAPIQIGNYVWVDLNNDGIQDPNEPPVTNVIVSLWKNGNQIASTPTNSKGEYYFSENSVAGVTWTGTGADTTLLPNTAYELKINLSTFNGYSLTSANSTINNGNDQTDNDANLVGSFATIALTTGDIGSVNHTYDFGLLCSGTINVSTTYSAATCPTTGINANNNASLQITTSGDRVAISTNGIPTTLYAAANLITSGSYTFTALNGAADTFYLRVWNGPVCYKDTLMVVNPIRCCPTINAVSTPANNTLYCSGTFIPAFNVTTNAIATDSIRLVSFTSKQTNSTLIYSGTPIATKVISGVSTTVSNTANFANVPLPENVGTSNDTLWIYAIYMDQTGDTSCKVWVEKPVIIKPEPIASIHGFPTVCNGSSVNLMSQLATSYKWGKSPSASILATTQNYNPTPTSNTTNTYWLVTTNAGNCSSDTAFFNVMASQGIQGMVFRDFDSDGILDANETNGFKNIKIKLFDSLGILIDSSLTDIYGRYAFPAVSANMGKMKIEFDQSSFPAFTQQSFAGSQNGTDVQFVNAPNCSVHLGLKETRDYCGVNPKIVTPILIDGAASSSVNVNGLNEGLYSLNYSNYSAKTVEATRNEIGSTWGIGYAKKTKQVFSAAFLKRHVGLKDGKLGQIYVTDMNTLGTPTTPWLDVSTLGLSGNWQYLTDAQRGLANAGTPSIDSLSFSQIAKIGLGDIDVSEDETQLYVMDLSNKQLLIIDIATKTLIGAYAVPTLCTNPATPSYYCAFPKTFTSSDGKFWKNGHYFNTDNNGVSYNQAITNPNNVVAGTSDAALYNQSIFNGNGLGNFLKYQFPVENGNYTVKLHTITNSITNASNFNIVAEETVVFNNVNVYAEAGNLINTAIVKTFTTTVNDGVLDIQLLNNAAGTAVIVSGFEIIPTSSQVSGQTRPFAIKAYKGKIYVGAVCDANGSQSLSDLNAGVFVFDLQTNSFETSPVATVPLNYPKGPSVINPTPSQLQWFPWTSVYPNNTSGGIFESGFDVYNQPVLSDIEFDIDGSMILGFFDRMGHQMGAAANVKPNGQTTALGVVGGDILRLFFNGTNYELENNAKEGASSNKPATAGINNNEGPGGGEFYWGDELVGSPTQAHKEILMGGLALLPGSGEVRATVGDALVFSSGALASFNNTSGAKQNSFTMYTGATGGTQWKSNGLGDLEILCELAPLQIGNYVWFDQDQDGIQDPAETPIENATVTLWKGTTLIATTTTNSKGEYYFSENSIPGVVWVGTGSDSSLLPNTAYTIQIDKSSHPMLDTLSLTQTNSTQANANDQNDNDATLLGNIASIQLITGSEGSVNHSYDFGFTTPPSFGSIGNYVWFDSNANGLNDESSSSGINGIMVYLFNQSNPSLPIDSVLTSANAGNPGYYLFDSLMSGSYFVKFPSTYLNQQLSPQTITPQTDDNNDANPLSGLSPLVIIDANGTGQDKDNTTIDAGYFTPACLGNFVWHDINKDGLQNNNEVGVAGITVGLWNNSNMLVASTITDAYGYYQFCPLNPGNYKLSFTLPASYVFTSVDQGSNDSTDSDVNPFSGFTGTYTLIAGDSNWTIDAGIYFQRATTATVGNYVWFDTNQDGIQDAGEEGISGVTVTLYNAAGNPVATTITDANGFYLFTEVAPGNYNVGFTPPVGLMFSPNNGSLNNPSNSDVNPLSGMTNTFVVNAGDEITEVDAGLYSQPVILGALGDKVWNDMNQNGVQDPDENGVAGIIVQLFQADGITLISSTTTDAYGQYIFNQLPAGEYIIGFSNLPVDYIFTNTAGSDSATNSNPIPATGKTPIIQLGQGQYNMTIDAGIFNNIPTNTNSLGNFVWDDLNKDGIQDINEPGVAGVTVQLFDATQTLLHTTSTNAQGFYLFPDLANGTYHVGFSNLPLGYVFSTNNQGIDTLDSDADPATGMSPDVLLTGNTHDRSLDAGINLGNTRIGKATVGDLVWYDMNNNGIQDINELGVPKIVVHLCAADGITILDSTTTDALGNYIFTGLDAGVYGVAFSNLPAGFSVSPKNSDTEGLQGENNSDVNIATQKTDLFPLGIGEDKMSVDMGITPPSGTASLGNLVWFDLNNDGLQSANEPGVQGISVTLCNEFGAPIQTTTTNALGQYLFSGLTPGTYAVAFSNLPNGYQLTSINVDGNGIQGPANSDADPINGKTAFVTLAAGDNNQNLDAGVVSNIVASVGDYVWFDINRDGIQDAGESPIGGVLVTLYDDLNIPLSNTITKPDGGYIFTNLNPGNYSIGFSNTPSGMDFTIQEIDPNALNGSNANPLNGITPLFNVPAGTHNPGIDAGLSIPALCGLGNFVWIDANVNGIQDNDEIPVPGVLATLYAANGTTLLGSAVSNGEGLYSFTNLEPGTYVVGFSNFPPNYNPTVQNGPINDSLNSDMKANGFTDPVTLVSSEFNPHLDAGIYQGFALGAQQLVAQMARFTKQNACEVYWYTQTEKNSSHFILERSFDGLHYESVKTITASIQTNGLTYYQHIDEHEDITGKEKLYYRIRLVDMNQQQIISNTVTASRENSTLVTIYPSPFNDQIQVNYLAEEASDVEMKLVDLAGRTVAKSIQPVQKGANYLVFKNLNALAVGQYHFILRDINTNEQFIQKILK